jgi:branched-chain amino acid aminotransferase
MAMRDAKARDAVEVLFLDDDDNVLEGSTSNLFAFIDDRLVTPGRGILFGITRTMVLEIAAQHYPVEIRDLPRTELLRAQEVFITGTNKGLVPVVQIDETKIGTGRPGAETGNIMKHLKAHLAGLLH